MARDPDIVISVIISYHKSSSEGDPARPLGKGKGRDEAHGKRDNSDMQNTSDDRRSLGSSYPGVPVSPDEVTPCRSQRCEWDGSLAGFICLVPDGQSSSGWESRVQEEFVDDQRVGEREPWRERSISSVSIRTKAGGRG